MAYSIAALIMLAASWPFQFLSLSATGQSHVMRLAGGISTMLEQGYWLLAVIQVLIVFAIPSLILTGILYLAVPLLLGQPAPKYSGQVLNLIERLHPWGMAEIFLIGVLVSLVKISSLADVGFGTSFYTYLFFTILMVMTLLQYDDWQLRQRLGVQLKRHESSGNTQSIWALLIASAILFIPANTLPIMSTTLFGRSDPNTIIGGAVVLWDEGSYLIASVILVASVIVPLVKIIILSFLTYSIQVGSFSRPDQRLSLYKWVEAIGRWSMIDVFVVSVLVALVQFDNAITIYPGPAVMSFALMVILTMFVTLQFNTRLIWLQVQKGS
ncbi:paraquat-inducible protein A [Porticoccaceae bacterium LTM1]|nr:paraquat-inducible protein A [Porticoccaceae bacterium LTM1]